MVCPIALDVLVVQRRNVVYRRQIARSQVMEAAAGVLRGEPIASARSRGGGFGTNR